MKLARYLQKSLKDSGITCQLHMYSGSSSKFADKGKRV